MDLLMIENTLFESHFDMIPFGIYVVDVTNYEIIFINRYFKEHFGEPTETCCYKAIYKLQQPCPLCKMHDLIDANKLPNDKTFSYEQFNEIDDQWYQINERAMTWPDGRIVKYSIFVNISELKETQNQLAEAHAQLALKNKELGRLSTTDTLTNIANRLQLDRLFKKEVERSIRSGRSFSIILLDLDKFKSINDQFGHNVGDATLVSIAKLMGETIRKTDALGRWGGEEFLIICPETEEDGARTLAENLRRQVQSFHFPFKKTLTASFGISTYKPGDSPESMTKRADTALYKAKSQGRNRVEIPD